MRSLPRPALGRLAAAGAAGTLLAACTITQPVPPLPEAPPTWHAPRPAQGATWAPASAGATNSAGATGRAEAMGQARATGQAGATDPARRSSPSSEPQAAERDARLALWWTRFDDPLVGELVAATQAANASLAEAAARIAQARAALRIAGAADAPTLGANAGSTRARTVAPELTATTTAFGLDALWEIDLFGVARNSAAAARARVDSAQAGWHELRVSLAAETAATYLALRACEQLVDVYAQDAESQRRTRDLTQIKVDAGLDAPANGALAAAAAADAGNRLVAQRAECEGLVKSLVVLTALPEAELRAKLAPRRAQLPQPAVFGVDAVPGAVLAQRPDLAALAAELRAAASEVGAARADQYPRLSITGSIRAGSVHAGGTDTNALTWSFGPGLVLPLLDGGRRAGNVDGAQARLDAAAARATQRLREAVREVETALTQLDAATRREADAQVAAVGFRRFFAAQQARWEVGAGSLLDLEDARRLALTAAAALVNVQRERVAAWITLYKATGGGWTAADSHALTLPAPATNDAAVTVSMKSDTPR